MKNKATGKVFLASSLNVEGSLNKQEFLLASGAHKNKALQADWQKFGREQFEFTILEKVKVTDDAGFNLKDELTLLEEIWLEQLQPVGENGYNTSDKIREA
ncbi:MAG: GIY-YIG nuclease family protein [Candidatus Marinimicrobia bacterium]|nr:GIY-YIG nuclease family protein [Candidatus Neomarinimicrobiota bacterium]